MAFVPNPLPPPKLDFASLAKPLERATMAIGELSGIGRTLPNPALLIEPFKRVEAVASSKIEGTVTTVSELLIYEADSGANARADTREVRNYSRALERGLELLSEIPVSTRLIQELHSVLMANVATDRGANFAPGELKIHQNWIGGITLPSARFVPPPPGDARDCLSELEKYIHKKDEMPILVKLALIHYQFETIHPFPDGNGRVGRLLIPLILAETKLMPQPLLYLSTFFERHYRQYIDLMFEVSKTGAWEPWVQFFLQGIEQAARSAIKKSQALQTLQRQYHEQVREARASGLLAKLVDSLFNMPVMTVSGAQRELNVSYNSAKSHLERLTERNIVKPGPASMRPQWYFANGIIDITYSIEEADNDDTDEQLPLL